MNTNKEIKLMRIYMSNTDKFEKIPLYETVVYEAKKQNLAGATVLKGIMGFGSSSIVSTVKLWEVSEKIPVVVEIIDEAEKIDNFYSHILHFFEKVEKGILVTTEPITVVFQKTGKNSKGYK